jgi:hypothetical protein
MSEARASCGSERRRAGRFPAPSPLLPAFCILTVGHTCDGGLNGSQRRRAGPFPAAGALPDCTLTSLRVPAPRFASSLSSLISVPASLHIMHAGLRARQLCPSGRPAKSDAGKSNPRGDRPTAIVSRK